MLSPYRYTADGIYSSIGSPSLPLAVKKAGFPDNTVILAHDTFSSAGISVPPEGFDAVVNQDVYSQGKAAIKAAEFFVRTMRYPYCKCTHIPSVILNNL
jgi:ABC-type sugar transport system substrate-binding protein